MAIRDKAILLVLLGLMAAAVPVAAIADTATVPAPSFRMAQLRLNLGLSERDARRQLSKNGYRDIRIIRSSFKNVHAEACFNGIRYTIKVRRLSGKMIRGNRIGKCRRPYDAREIAARLRKQGFDKISVSTTGHGGFIVSACEYDQRVRLNIDPYGKIQQRLAKGRCQRGPNIEEIRRQLREDGFTRVQVLRKNQGRLIVEACYDADRMRLRLAPNGRILRQEVTGSCARPIRPRNIARHLEKLGYRQIRVIDDQLPVYKAEACRQNSLTRIRMDRYGDVISTTRLGQCLPSLTRQQIVKMLQQRGANRVEVLSQDSRGFRAAGCYRLERRQYRIDLYGKILNREVIGRCSQAPRLNSVLKDFKSRGMRNLRILVEGCRKGRRLQIELDQYGDEINRQRIGRCQ